MDFHTRIMANARIHLTGVIDDALKVGLYNVVDDFCKETDIWKETMDFVTSEVSPSDIVYDLVPTNGTVLRLLDLATDTGISVMGMMEIPGELKITSPCPNGQTLVATVSLAPIDPTEVDTDLPIIADWIWQRYSPLFTDGLIGKMASEQDKPYTNPSLVAFHGGRFRNGISVARADRVKGHVADGQAWRFPFFA